MKIRLLLIILALGGLAATPALAYDCSSVPAYAPDATYDSGDLARNLGNAYQCDVGGWCSTGGAYAPGEGWAWEEAWSLLGQCDGDSSSSSSSLSSSASSSSSAATGEGCEGLDTWNANSVYTQDDRVEYNVVEYRARWWTQGDNPEQSGDWGVWENLGACEPASSSSSSESSSNSSSESSSSSSSSSAPGNGDELVVGYFTQWGIYDRNYHVKNIHTSGSAEKLTHIVYAFGNVQNGQCVVGDSYADYDRAYGAEESVDGVADTWEQGALRGNFGQLKRLKEMYPHIKVLWSFGGWTWSGGFGEAAQNPQQFAQSCHDLVFDPRWDGVFDGIDIDWEYPNECGLTCDNSGFDAYRELMQALRSEFGDQLVTAAIGAGEAKLNAADYGGAAQYLDFYMLMTYDYFGAWEAQGPTAPHSPLNSYSGIPQAGFHSDNSVQILKGLGVPDEKILLGIGFYGRGWTGVSQAAPGGSASGAANGTYESGIEDYKVLKNTCPATGTVAGTAYAHCGDDWWSYDTPATIQDKMNYLKQQGLGGAFFWELSGDTEDGELIDAIDSGL
ncbi:glycosyl hydrolase family 18 protein [Marinimicrobium sp. C6131]|uniref:glycosyl hydrolase family 18 protein n=1 Tax=Marinimicrobium sp. C6131 TaxID=3022676 RepID=UPI00223E0476|nr:glycosyl hydrolase family 18 protein [Marinimicrobium sp. C6131]UZJ43725.1 glycosyl hydrolase family 18 protein [Marinimicrobium sp. C6131]